MQRGVIIALSASLVLVGWATWHRYVSSPGGAAGLMAVSSEEVPQGYYDELIAKFTDLTASSSPTEKESLTTTDLVSRQLVSDYLALAQSGQMSDENLSALADHYSASLADITQSTTVSIQDVTVVDDTAENAQRYITALSAIYKKHASALIGTDSALAENISKKNYAFVLPMAKAHEEQASELKKLPVPAALTQSHIQLINANLLNAAALQAMAKMGSDPVVGIAGSIALSQNAAREGAILNQILKIVKDKSNGI